MVEAKDILRAELKRRRLTYADLGKLLDLKEETVKKKIARGGFSADWLLTCLRAIGCETIRLD